MVNPTLGVAFYKEKSTIISDTLMYVNINYAKVNGYALLGNGTYSQMLRFPLFEDNDHININIEYNSAFYKVDTIKIDVTTINDTLSIADTLSYKNYSEIDTVETLKTFCNIDTIQNIQICTDTLLYVIKVSYADTSDVTDTIYLGKYSQEMDVYYTPRLVPISPECGFGYEYRIDSVKIDSEINLKSVDIVVEKAEIPEDIYEEEPVNININL